MIAIDNNIVMIGVPNKNSNIGEAYSLVIPISSPLKFKVWVIIIIVVAVIGVGVTIFLLAKNRRDNDKKNINDDSLLEFPPRTDMNFIDIHGPEYQNQRRPSIKSGSSLVMNVTQYSNTTLSSQTTN